MSSWFLALLLVATISVVYGANIVIYDDQFKNNWSQSGWASTANWADTAQKQSGTNSISFTPNNWDGLYFLTSSPFLMAKYDTLEFYIRGNTASGQILSLNINHNSVSNPKASAPLNNYISGGSISATEWRKVSIPFISLGININNAYLQEFFIQDGSGTMQTKIYLDSFQLIDNGLTPYIPPQEVNIDLTLNRRVINPEIYGVNHADATHFTNVRYTVNRKGGNAETRFNWEKATTNKAHDWFYFHIPETVSNANLLPEGSSATQLVDISRQYNSAPMLTAPLIGFVARDDRIKLWSYSQNKYGSQTNDECRQTNQAFWCTEDAGNGELPPRTKILNNDWRDANKQIDSTYVTRWMQFWKARNTTIKYWSLDNEPHLWSSTHQDVFPNPVTYQDLWTRTVTYASAMKQMDPSIITFGPVSWGWCEYFFSAADDCRDGADKAANGNIPWLEFYAQNVCNYKQQNGIMLADYLDIHYYPAGTNVALSDDDSTATAALRLRQLKSLFDPTYVDESWIAKPVNLIPTMKNIIQTRCPEMKFAITEYNFGNDDVYSAALAQVEVLGIFGREGVDLATRWVVPSVGTFAETAFQLFLNYDGQHSNLFGTSVLANSTVPYDKLGVYAIHNWERKHLYVVMVNKETSVLNFNITIAQHFSSSIQLYGFTSQSKNIANLGTTSLVNGRVAMNLNARSAVLAVVSIPDAINPVYSTESPKNSPGPQTSSKSPNNDITSATTSTTLFQITLLIIIIVVLSL